MDHSDDKRDYEVPGQLTARQVQALTREAARYKRALAKLLGCEPDNLADLHDIELQLKEMPPGSIDLAASLEAIDILIRT